MGRQGAALVGHYEDGAAPAMLGVGTGILCSESSPKLPLLHPPRWHLGAILPEELPLLQTLSETGQGCFPIPGMRLLFINWRRTALQC